MIIMFQVKDKKHIEIIKQFLDDKALFDLTYYNSEKDLIEFKNDIDRTDVIKYKCKTTVHEKTEIQKIMLKNIQQTFINYIYLKHLEEKDILKNTIIKVVNLIMDIDFNNERIYYISSRDKYITM